MVLRIVGALLVLWLLLVILGIVIKGLLWLALIAILFFVATAIWGWLRRRV